MTLPEDDAGLEILLDYLKHSRGFDFTGYKRASLARRIEKRLRTAGVERPADYVDYLEVHPEEFGQLFTTILINVTAFFRDPTAWDHLAREIVPRLLKDKEAGAPVRLWSAGCASGEEAYTLAITLTEAMGMDAFRDRVKIYGTDVDEEALTQARQAVYPAAAVAGVPPPLLEKYFEPQGDRYAFNKDLRRSVIFGRHDLIQDAPISRLDLLVCRNVLMYFNAETQARVLDHFQFALNDGGCLFLGRAETLLTHSAAFAPIELKRRLFVKTPRLAPRDRPWAPSRAAGDDDAGAGTDHYRVREAALDAAPVPQLVVDAHGFLVFANQPARALFGIGARDMGRPLRDLELSYRPVELRSCIEQAAAGRQPVVLREVPWREDGDGGPSFVDVQVTPLGDGDGVIGASITFNDVTRHRRLQEELQRANGEVEAAYQELQSTNEELETTNEELQSTVEELETTNEELQSTNEELETMNEELHSANEELQTINKELSLRSGELNQANTSLESILTSLRGGVVVVDRDLLVLIWNRRSEELWGLRADEVCGKNFLNLDIGLPVESLRQSLRTCLTGEASYQEVTLDAMDRRGRPVRCKVICTPLRNQVDGTRGAILLTEEERDGVKPR